MISREGDRPRERVAFLPSMANGEREREAEWRDESSPEAHGEPSVRVVAEGSAQTDLSSREEGVGGRLGGKEKRQMTMGIGIGIKEWGGRMAKRRKRNFFFCNPPGLCKQEAKSAKQPQQHSGLFFHRYRRHS